MLHELVFYGDGDALEALLAKYNAEEERRARAYDAAVWQSIQAQAPITLTPSAQRACPKKPDKTPLT